MTSPTISSHSSLAASYQFISDRHIPSLLFQMKTLPHNHKYHSNINLLQSAMSSSSLSTMNRATSTTTEESHEPLTCHHINSSLDFYPNQTNPLKLLKTHPSLIYRLHLAKVIDEPHLGHSGCVNSVAWIPPEDCFHCASSLGASHYLGNEDMSNMDSLLISGSDDCCIKIWNSHSSECKWTISTPHTGNIFCVKWFPHCNLDRIISSAADSKICIYEHGRHTRTIKEHMGMVHRVCIENSSPHVFISISQDGYVKLFDLRQPTHEHVNLLHLQTGGGSSTTGTNSRLVRFSSSSAASIDINSIDMNPRNSNEIILGCDDPFVRLFDRRKIMTSSSSDTTTISSNRDQVIEASTVQKYCPAGLLPSNDSSQRPHSRIPLHVTGVRFNKYGDEIVATYSGDHIYLFDKCAHTRSTAENSPVIAADAKMSYIGHCNIRTVKEVNFFGECSEYILSGSDCGHVFVWDKHTGCIINVIKGDSHVVNCLAPHPIYPGVLATSGIEHNIKLFEMGVLDYMDDNPETSCYEKNIAFRDANKMSSMWTDEEHEEEPHAVSTSSTSSSSSTSTSSKHDRVSRLISENERKTREGHSSLILPASMVFNLMQLLASQSDEEDEEENTGRTSTTNTTNAGQQQQQRRRRRAQEIFQLLEELGGHDSSGEEENENQEEEEESRTTTRSCRTM
ncbi:hypothetical protein C9374_009160 [Naegleria lovaniensis]|uniref:Guanine nucleotide-binding protein subunit beta-like protein n=1 Tax=Naegleria lovaniensis TaxID=51637 RepID=A0AA88GHM1_NAELO|nr:uncharacterized protein C9374_009160 [Naegleria lovaniensis]KAG2377644.1 hypothetical protein C9374_009160 [Naegleria lovaniensis]